MLAFRVFTQNVPNKVFIKPFKELALALNAHVVIEVKKSDDLIQSVKKFYEL